MRWICMGLVLLSAVLSADWASGEVVSYAVAGTTYEGYVERVEGAPLILLLHDWDGLTQYEITRAGMLAKLGYSVFCADLFGAGVRPTALEDKRKCTSMLDADRSKMRALMAGALKKAESMGLDIKRCVVMGYCFGGTAALEFARSGADLKGFATFHGGLALPDGQDYSKAKGEYLILHSITDGMAPFSALAEDLEKSGLPAQLISYTGAPHGWTVFGSPRYREKPDRESWTLFTKFLEDTLK